MADQYRVLTGLNYPGADEHRRAEPGEIVDDLPKKSVGWLLEDGHIEKVSAAELRDAQKGGS